MSSEKFSIKPLYIYVYLRVSTHAQTHKSNGLEEQNEICQAYIKNNFPKLINCVEFYTDIGSSYNEKNNLTNLNKLIRKISSQTKVLLLVRDISRLGRNTFQVFNLLKKIKNSNSFVIGIENNLCYNYSKPMDRKFSHAIIDSEEHSDTKSIKLINRIKKIKLAGGYVGKVPYGCMVVKKNNIPFIYKNPSEIDVLVMIKQIYLKYKNISKTTKYLNKNNFKYRNGIEWKDTQISNYLTKFFPNVLLNKNSSQIDKYFSTYSEYQENIDSDDQLYWHDNDLDTITNKLSDAKLSNTKLTNSKNNTSNTTNTNDTDGTKNIIKPKRKYTKYN